jgi:virginiamycin B lyase
MIQAIAVFRALRGTVFALVATGSLLLAVGSTPALSKPLPGMGLLEGTVAVEKPLGPLTVYAYNAERRIGYMVYVVGGRYRATNLFPGQYEVTLRGTVGQRNWSLPQQTVKRRIVAGRTATADFKVGALVAPPTYVGGMTYPDAQVLPYDVIYPPGPARDTLERVCFGCHTSSFYPYNVVRTYPTGRTQFDRDGWGLTVDRMAHGLGFFAPGKPSYFDPLLLSPTERDALVDYLGAHFGPGSTPRAVRQDSDPPLDEAALAKAQIVEYRFPNDPKNEEEARFTHTPDFDGQGNVWIMDRGGESLVKIEPTKGRITDHKGHGGGEFLVTDRDGTVWYGGLSHFDPAQNLHDEYKFEGKPPRGIGISSLVMDSAGDIWLSMLTGGGLAKFDRKANSVVWWDVPILRSRPYGIIVDHDDNVWFAEYHNSGLGRFDPKTESFRHYALTVGAPTNIRRLGVDSKNFIWSATWGSRALQNGALYRVDPASGAVDEYRLGIPYANPYDVEIDANDTVWIATDNHVMKFDPATRRFTSYPVAERTDIPKLAVTRDGAIWYGPRNAGQSGGYGGAAAVLYPDKDAIETFDAFYAKGNPRNRKAGHDWPAIKVTGTTKLVPAAPRNPCEFAKTVGLGAGCEATPKVPGAAPATIQGGAARE